MNKQKQWWEENSKEFVAGFTEATTNHTKLDEQSSAAIDEGGTVTIVLPGGEITVLTKQQAYTLLDFLYNNRALLYGKEEGEVHHE